MSNQSKCPVCRQPLSKKYRRSLTNVEWLKLQLAHQMADAENYRWFIRELQRRMSENYKSK